MSLPSPTLHMLCGKPASGKSTLTARLGRAPGTVVVSEDDWLAALFADQMASVADYARCAERLRAAMGPHVSTLLNAGLSVVLDFPANTVATRNWMRGILQPTGAAHCLHVLDTPDAVCLDRLRARNASGDHPFAVTEAQFAILSRHFVPPSAEEGFTVLRHRPDDLR
ncbi:ATP-binding protein [Seohaeicola saemankumensis]|nr:ATP-binding protein [Seohaeicola saemankumensis]MCA0871124.1 ATP-binding protein [Seohaeicola saemankumensis]